MLLPLKSSRFNIGDRVIVPFGTGGEAEADVVATGIGFAFRRKVRVEREGVKFEVDEDQVRPVPKLSSPAS